MKTNLKKKQLILFFYSETKAKKACKWINHNYENYKATLEIDDGISNCVWVYLEHPNDDSTFTICSLVHNLLTNNQDLLIRSDE